eukprot:scaffold929_cov387-Prasinococcus_capsulatus_cf.AAC.5
MATHHGIIHSMGCIRMAGWRSSWSCTRHARSRSQSWFALLNALLSFRWCRASVRVIAGGKASPMSLAAHARLNFQRPRCGRARSPRCDTYRLVIVMGGGAAKSVEIDLAAQAEGQRQRVETGRELGELALAPSDARAHGHVQRRRPPVVVHVAARLLRRPTARSAAQMMVRP